MDNNRGSRCLEGAARTMKIKKCMALICLVVSSFVAFGLFNPVYGLDGSAPNENKLATATFAGGCFWCMEHPFDHLDGVISTTDGYTGGFKVNPTYQEVSSGATGHTESVQVLYDPTQISYEELLAVFWRNIDPLDPTGQFCDKGSQYRSAIFYHDESQRQLAEQSKMALENAQRFSTSIVTEIVSASEFYAAEDYHQDYYQKHPIRYQVYRFGCGRDQRLSELWPDDDEG